MSTAATLPADTRIEIRAVRERPSRLPDPRTYLAGFVSIAIWVSTATGLPTLSLWAGGLLMLLLVQLTRYHRRVRSVVPVGTWIVIAALTTILLYALFGTKGDEVRTLIWGLQFSPQAFWLGVAMALRLIALVLLSSILLLSVPALDMAAGMTRLLLPFRRIGVPVTSLFFLSFFLVRMIPSLLQESRLIKMAQRSRRIGTRGGVFRSWQSHPALIIPVFAAALRRSDAMALAFASRGFDTKRVPSRVTQLTLKSIDYILLSTLALAWAVWVYLRLS